MPFLIMIKIKGNVFPVIYSSMEMILPKVVYLAINLVFIVMDLMRVNAKIACLGHFK